MYECHITYADIGFAHVRVREYAERFGWKLSYIKGDPQFGHGSRWYLTCHDVSLSTIFAKMRKATQAKELPDPIREKIEHIIHDPINGLSLEEE